MFRKPIIWIVFVLLAAVSIYVAVTFFPQAFPIVTMDLQMDRVAALQKANDLADRYQWGPEGYDQAASFSGDQHVQYYVELEAGGNEALREMMQSGLYHPYTWTVRHYHPGETLETLVTFKPDGDPYGFSSRLPEDDPGPSIPADSARAIAEDMARSEWQVDFSPYRLVESSEDVRLGGRTDHTFVYERTDVKIGQAYYRLKLSVAGDQLTEVKRLVNVPEAFDRRYEEMRSRNEMLSMFGTGFIILLYGVVGILVGLFYLLKQRYLLWRKPLLWALFIALLQVFMLVNRWPLMWMSYDTALSPTNFYLQRFLLFIGVFIGETLLLAVTFMVAESLSRKAFPHHAQFWKLWRKEPASTPHVWGLTLGGYLWVPLTLAYVIGFYWVTSHFFGWWSPSDVLFQPDLLATYFPWLTSIAISLHAGFWEETLFRAIPLAGAVLLGRRYGKTGVWLFGALILQALVFGAGHANYPQQPAYARIAELFVPFLFYGIIYVVFGLLPVIIAHFTVDVVWIALPLFVSTAEGIWVDRALVIILTLVPLWVILVSRLRTGQWLSIKPFLNRTWSPPPPKTSQETTDQPVSTSMSTGCRRALWGVGLAGIVLWLVFSSFGQQATPLHLRKTGAIDYAQTELTLRGIELPETYRTLSRISQPLGTDDRFVWQTGGVPAYDSLMDDYLSPPRWMVRYATFEGDVEERAEEHLFYLGNDGELFRYTHKLPESRSGARLEEDDARDLAVQHIKTRYNLNADTLMEVSAEPSKLPERTDWTFAFADTSRYPLSTGQARIWVRIGGDQITDTYTEIYVPEEWTRAERNQTNVLDILNTTAGGLLLGVLFAGVIAGIISWSRKRFSVRLFLITAGVVLLIRIVLSANSWPSIIARFATAQPWDIQTLIVLIGIAIGAIVVSLALGMVVGYLSSWVPRQSPQKRGVVLAVLAALSLQGIASVVLHTSPSLEPSWSDYRVLGDMIPFVSLTLGSVIGFLMLSAFFLLTFRYISTLTHFGGRRPVLLVLLSLVAGFILAGEYEVPTVWAFLLATVVLGGLLLFLYLCLFRHQLNLVWIFTATFVVLDKLAEAVSFTQSLFWLGIGCSIVIVVMLGVVFFLMFSRSQTDA
jgi:MFS family permease/membrane protease YdiL (CAAX protease family)